LSEDEVAPMLKYRAIKTCEGMVMYLRSFVTVVLDGGELSVSCFGRFTPEERSPGTHWIGGWVGLSAGVDMMAKEKPNRDQTPVVRPVTSN